MRASPCLAAPMTRSYSCLPGTHHSGMSSASSACCSNFSFKSGKVTTSSRNLDKKSTRSNTLRALSSLTASTDPDTSSARPLRGCSEAAGEAGVILTSTDYLIIHLPQDRHLTTTITTLFLTMLITSQLSPCHPAIINNNFCFPNFYHNYFPCKFIPLITVC